MIRILVVDDSAFFRRRLKELLQECGCEVVGEAGDGAAAIDNYKELRPNVVFMDITMPNVDGMSALTEIMSFDVNAKVVMISAIGQKDIIETALQTGAYTYITKPIENDQVKAVIVSLTQL